MDRRIGAAAVVLAATVACAGCGPHLQSNPERSTRSSDAPQAVATTPTQTPAPFVDPQPDVRRRGIEFVRSSLAYDASAEDRAAFLSRVRPLVTADELIRLRQSERAQLSWSVLRQRQERVALRVTGASVDSGGSVPVLIVEAVRTTKTAFATVLDLVEVTIAFQAAKNGWLITSATGGGL